MLLFFDVNFPHVAFFSLLRIFSVALISCFAISMLHSFRVSLFSYCFLFTLYSFHVALFPCCTFQVALSPCATLFMLLSYVSFFRAGFLWRTAKLLPVFHVLCKTCNLEILLKHLPPSRQVVIFFRTPRWSVNALKICCNKKRIKAPIEYDRRIVIGIKIDDKNISTLSKISSDLRSQRQ